MITAMTAITLMAKITSITAAVITAAREITAEIRMSEVRTTELRSAFLGAVLALGLSRDKAKAAVIGGVVAVSGRVEQRPDREVVQGDALSVRGHGKFVIGKSGTTSRGRVRLAVKKYN